MVAMLAMRPTVMAQLILAILTLENQPLSLGIQMEPFLSEDGAGKMHTIEIISLANQCGQSSFSVPAFHRDQIPK